MGAHFGGPTGERANRESRRTQTLSMLPFFGRHPITDLG